MRQVDACRKVQHGQRCTGVVFLSGGSPDPEKTPASRISQFQVIFFVRQSDKSRFSGQIMPPLMEMTWPLM
jgi:hypothetical protein